MGGAAALRQHVLRDGAVRARSCSANGGMRPASAGGIRSGFFRLLPRGRSVIDFGWGAALLAFLTLERVVELWWAKQNERRLFAAGGMEDGHSHLILIVLLHAAWIVGLWALAYDRPV